MATLLDTSIISFLSPVFIFLFLFAVFFALMRKFKIFGEKSENLSSIAALALSFLIVLSTPGRTVVATMTPMIAVVFVLVFLAFLFFMFLGVKDEDMVSVTKHSSFQTVFIIIFIVIFLISLTQAFGPIFQVNAQAGFWNSTKRAIFSPKVLGALFLLTVTAYTVRYLGSSNFGSKS